jgi:hypothetical protein
LFFLLRKIKFSDTNLSSRNITELIRYVSISKEAANLRRAHLIDSNKTKRHAKGPVQADSYNRLLK